MLSLLYASDASQLCLTLYFVVYVIKQLVLIIQVRKDAEIKTCHLDPMYGNCGTGIDCVLLSGV